MKKLDENVSSFIALVQGAWFFEKTCRKAKGREHALGRVQMFLGAVSAARDGRPEEFYSYLRPVLNEVRLDLDDTGRPDVKPIDPETLEQLNNILPLELQWAFSAFVCLDRIRWEEFKDCNVCGRPFYGGGKKRKYCGRRCMLKANSYKPERDRERAKIRNFIHRIQKKGNRVEPMLSSYLKKRGLNPSFLSAKWQKALKVWEEKSQRKKVRQ